MTKTQLTLFWVLSLLCLAPGAMAQGTQNFQSNFKTYSGIFDSKFKLNPNATPNGYLYDRVYPTANLKNLKECDTIEPQTVFQGWWEMEQSNLSPTRNLVYQELREEARRIANTTKIPIACLDFESSAFDQIAFEDGRITMEDDAYTILGDPYITFRSSLAAFANCDLQTETTYSIYLDHHFFVSNTGSQPIKAIITNHGNSEFFEINLNDTSELRFSIEGDIRFGIKVFLNDGSIICNSFTAKVLSKAKLGKAHCDDAYRIIVESDIPFQGLTESVATTTIGDAHVYPKLNSMHSCKITKPIIIVDGFDPMDKRNFERIYSTVSYGPTNSRQNLIQDMRSLGYDVIILNFPILGSQAIDARSNVKMYKNGTFEKYINLDGRDGGADYIERNAFLTVKLIQMINDSLIKNHSADSLIVIGPSMGGLITRYALAYMEKQDSMGRSNMKHKTRLWLSFDAPHDGANIPISTQTMIDFFATFKGDQRIQDIFTLRLRSFAARQLLVQTYDHPDKHDYQCHEHHNSFYSDLRNNGINGSEGWPKHVRKISVLNGNLNGIKTLVSGNSDIDILVRESNEPVFKVDARYGPEYNKTGKVLTSCFAVKDRVLFENWSCPIDEFDGISGTLTYNEKLKVFWWGIDLNYNNLNPKGNPDVAPGARYPQVNEITDTLLNEIKKAGISNPLYTIKEVGSDFTFIPSLSAAGLKNTNIPYDTFLGTTNLACANLTHFDNIYAPTKDEFHLQVTNENAKWILQEITKGQKGCEKMCVVMDNWPTLLCKGSSADLKLINLPTSSHSIYWEAGNSFSINSGQYKAAANVKAISTNQFDPYRSISVRITPSCAADQIIRQKIEIPNTTLNITGEEKICNFQEEYQALSTSEASNHFWFYGDIHGTYRTTNPYSNISKPTNSTDPSLKAFTTFGGSRMGNYTLFVEGLNVCGETMTGQKAVQIVPKSTCNGTLKGFDDEVELGDLSVYPNPSADHWTLYLTNPNDVVQDMRLFNMNGQLVEQKLNKVESKVIDVDGSLLPNGFYFLQITTKNGETLNHRLVKRPAGL